jgi:hypothetical protein
MEPCRPDLTVYGNYLCHSRYSYGLACLLGALIGTNGLEYMEIEASPNE